MDLPISSYPENVQRAAVLAEARRWIGTPWEHSADVLGAGVDCGMLLVRVFVDTGLCEPFEPRPYARDFMLHSDQEMFLGFVNARGARVARPEDSRPGDVVVWQHGRLFSHGGIIVEWPVIIHAYAREQCVVEGDISNSPVMFDRGGRPREFQIYSRWGAGA